MFTHLSPQGLGVGEGEGVVDGGCVVGPVVVGLEAL